MSTDGVRLDNHYKHKRLATIYDDGNGWSDDREFYLSLAGTEPQRILDIGCGTGVLCHAYAALGHHVTGLDPAESMLTIAKAKAQGDKVTWANTSVQEFISDQKFDLITMTGHAFQCMLTPHALQHCLQTMRRQITPEGKIVFESRNPSIDWKSKWHHTSFTEGTGENEALVNRVVTEYNETCINFITTYSFSDETLHSDSILRFWDRAEVTEAATDVGLSVKAVYGDWDRSPFNPDTSEEIIFELQAE